LELTETVESINQRLVDHFGLDTSTGQAIWRVVWSEDQFEHRLGTYDDFSLAGLFLRTLTEVRYVPKYSQWLPNVYVLERLVAVPEANIPELPAVKLSYEPVYPFWTSSKVPLPPKFAAAKFAIDLIYSAQGKSSMAKYKDPDAGLSNEDQFEKKLGEIDKLQEELFGNESYVGDALAHKEAVIVPRNFEKRVK
jgi:hypothetical protein